MVDSIVSRFTQAAGLQPRNDDARPVRVIAVASGKGGVGKTNVSANLALALQLSGEQVLLMDADLGLANIDVLFGLQPMFHLGHVLEGRCTLNEALVQGPAGLTIVPAASGLKQMASLSHAEHVGLIRAFSELARPVDTLVVDTAAGIADSVTTFCRAAQEVLIVANNEPASLTDAYALIKVLSRDHGIHRAQVIANMIRSAADGYEMFEHLRRVSERFLDVQLHYLGGVPYDEYLQRAIRRQTAVVEAYPSAPASVAFRNLAAAIRKWPRPEGARGHVEFFVERLIGAGAYA